MPVAPELEVINSPLSDHIQHWESFLSSHPDRLFASYILSGLRSGFRVGFCWSKPLRSARRNIPSVYQHPHVIDQYIEKEKAAHNLVGPLHSTQLSTGQQVHINRIGIIPKGHSTEKWRLITNLSFPPDNSVNDGINTLWCSLEYTKVEKVALAAMSLGYGSLLAKIDIKSAYRIVPVHPVDRPLLGIKWKDRHYIDTKLPFGLRSAPKIFNALADALEWCFRKQGVTDVDHYLDDFITLGPPGSLRCAENLRMIREVTTALGVPLAEDKSQGPSTALVFLGILIDTQAGTLSLPEEKLSRIQLSLNHWMHKKFCRRKELESLVGLLHHAAKVVPPGRSFLQRMISHLRGGSRDNHFIRLNKSFKADLLWWKTFCSIWNGVAVIRTPKLPEIRLTTDASGLWGCGAFWDNHWFQFEWPPRIADQHITFKELVPIMLAITVWGHRWRGLHVHCLCDNEAVVAIVTSRFSKQSELMHLLRILEAHFHLHISASHIPGRMNMLADCLSRNQLTSFRLQGPQMDKFPTPLPLMAPDLLFDLTLDWSSPTWITLLSVGNSKINHQVIQFSTQTVLPVLHKI